MCDQWYLQRVQANRAWDIEKGSSSVKIMIIDSGVDLDHPELEGNVWDNSLADPKGDADSNGMPSGGWGFYNPLENKDVDGDGLSLYGTDGECDCGPDGDYGFGPNAIDDPPRGPGGGDDDPGWAINNPWLDNLCGPGNTTHPQDTFFNDDMDDVQFMKNDDDENGYPDDTHGINLYNPIQDFGLEGIADGLPGAKNWGGDGDVDKDGSVHFNDVQVRRTDFDGDGIRLYGPDTLCDAGPDGDYGFGANGRDDYPWGPGGGDDADPGGPWSDNLRGPGSLHPELEFDDDMDDVRYMRYDNEEDGDPFGRPRDDSCPIAYACHGTEMAGIIGAETDNGEGMAGFVWNCTLVPAKVAIGFPEYEYDPDSLHWQPQAAVQRLIQALDYAIDKHVDVVNMSLGCGPDTTNKAYFETHRLQNPLNTTALQAKISEAHNEGIILVAGAGNKSYSDSGYYLFPASYQHVISVSGVNWHEEKATYVTYNDSVDVCAPVGDEAADYNLVRGMNDRGSDCITTAYYNSPHGMFNPPGSANIHGYAATELKTSGASAQVSGLAAMLVSFYPRSRYEEMFPNATSGSDYADFIEREIKRGCAPLPNDGRYASGWLGAGRIDAYRSLTQWGTITGNTIWNDRVYVSADLKVDSSATLTILPGTTIYFAPEDDEDAGIDSSRVVFEIRGTLIADGTAENPITFKSFADDPGPEDWYGIWFKQGSSGSLSHCRIENAKHGLKRDAPIETDDCQWVWADYRNVQHDMTVDTGLILTVRPGTTVYVAPEDTARTEPDTLRVALSVEGALNAEGTAADPIVFRSMSEEPLPGDWYGILFADENSSGSLSNCVIQDARYGVKSAVTVDIADCQISNCLTAGIYMYDNMDTASVVNNRSTISNCYVWNNIDGAGMRIWNCPYAISVDSCTVTLNDCGIWVSNAAPVITASNMNANYSRGIWVTRYQYPAPYPYPVIQWCHMQGNGEEGIKCEYNKAQISYSKSWENGTYGILAYGDDADPVIDHSKIIDNPAAGMRVDSYAYPVLGNASTGEGRYNSLYGQSQAKNVYNTTSQYIYAQNCWWGSNPPNVSKFYGRVTYQPYLTSDPVYYLAPLKPNTPTVLSLEQNFPNPFIGTAGATTLKYSIPSESDRVVLKIFDVSGRRVSTLVDRPHRPGYYSARWDGRNERGGTVAPGVYFCEMSVGKQSFTKKIVLFR